MDHPLFAHILRLRSRIICGRGGRSGGVCACRIGAGRIRLGVTCLGACRRIGCRGLQGGRLGLLRLILSTGENYDQNQHSAGHQHAARNSQADKQGLLTLKACLFHFIAVLLSLFQGIVGHFHKTRLLSKILKSIVHYFCDFLKCFPWRDKKIGRFLARFYILFTVR